MARTGCYRCPSRMAQQCSLDFGLDGCPPCADTAEAVDNSAQQLKPKMPSFEELREMIIASGVCSEIGFTMNSFDTGVKAAYYCIARHFGH